MRNVDEYIQTYVEKDFQLHAYSIAEELWDLLKVLDEKGFLRPQLRGTIDEGKRETHVLIERNADGILASFNKFYRIYENKESREKFVEFMREFGFSDKDLMHSLHSQLIFAFLLNAETFKNFFTFILKNINPKTATLGKLFNSKGKMGILVKQTQETGEAQKISKRLDIGLRNSLAHFAFREEGETIYCYDHEKKNDKWSLKERKIQSADLFKKTQEHSLLRAILAPVIADWYGL